jgi:glycine/sarcosine N-methyltransferase
VSNTNAFYDAIADDYHLFYKDWWAAVAREEAYFDALFRPRGIQTVLDASCGPGTQAIGLARSGYTVTAADPSAALLDRAREHARGAGVALTFVKSSYAQLMEHVRGPFDAIITTGNSLPHLIADADIAQALANFAQLIKPGGILLIGVRDFDAILAERPRFYPRYIHDREGERIIGFDVWDYDDGPPPTIKFHNFAVRGADDDWSVSCNPVIYRALRQDELRTFMQAAGFGAITRVAHAWELVLMASRQEGR